MPNKLSIEQIADLVRQKQFAELAFRTAEKQVKNQQGGSVADLMALRGERDRLYIVFTELDRKAKALSN